MLRLSFKVLSLVLLAAFATPQAMAAGNTGSNGGGNAGSNGSSNSGGGSENGNGGSGQGAGSGQSSGKGTNQGNSGNGNAGQGIRGPAAAAPPAPGSERVEVVRDQRVIRDAIKSRQALPLDALSGVIAGESTGRVLDIELLKLNGMLIYDVTVIEPNGLLRRLYYHARSGRRVDPR